MNPLADLPLRSRADLQRALLALVAPLERHASAGGARVRVGVTGAHYPDAAAELEGFARPLWGLAPLAAGGGSWPGWARWRRGLVNGTDPRHPEYWGDPAPGAQLLVEMAALALGLTLARGEVWDPLTPGEQARVGAWLARINRVQCGDNNWLFFRVLVNVALEEVGAPFGAGARDAARARLDEFYQGDGWYADGAVEAGRVQLDYYVPFALHFYGLIYAALRGGRDPQRAALYRERAALFARDFLHWFAPGGAAVPFGRSLTYRFAMGAFWGALAYAGVEALPWGVLRGLWLRHLRWWARRPIFDAAGILSIGYAYPNLNMAEEYNSPQSPYWALKFFLPLALPQGHPFWQAEEEDLPALDAVRPQPHPGVLVCRGHVFILSGRQTATWPNHGPEKYAKFAYSTAFGFSVPVGHGDLSKGAFDSVLALADDPEHFRPRERSRDCRVGGDALCSRWRPWPDVEVETWLLPALPWHVRVHRVRTGRHLWSAEGGWALDRTGDDGQDRAGTGHGVAVDVGGALSLFPAGASGIRDLLGARTGEIVRAAPNTNLLHPRTVIPTLRGELAPGEHLLACAVLGLPGTGAGEARTVWESPPQVSLENGTLGVTHGGKTIRLALGDDP